MRAFFILEITKVCGKVIAAKNEKKYLVIDFDFL